MAYTKILVVSNTWFYSWNRIKHDTYSDKLTFPKLSYVISMMESIVINILIVKYFAEKYNEKIRAEN